MGLSLPASCSGCPRVSGVPWRVMVGYGGGCTRAFLRLGFEDPDGGGRGGRAAPAGGKGRSSLE
jgi:hypothetical protein